MTRTEAGYESTRNALAILERGLASMTRRRAEFGPNFRFEAEQVVEEILKLRAELDEYTGLAAFLREFGAPRGADAIPHANGAASTPSSTPAGP